MFSPENYPESCKVSIHSVFSLDAWFGPGCHASSEVWLGLWEHRGGGTSWVRGNFLEKPAVTTEGRKGCGWRLFQVRHGLGATALLQEGLAHFLCKGPGSKYYRFVGRLGFVVTTQLCSCSMKALVDDLSTNEHSCVSVKLTDWHDP